MKGRTWTRLFTDKVSGKDVNRLELQRLLEFVREGVVVVIHSMDRLARKIVKGLTAKGVTVQFINRNLIFTGENSPMYKLKRRLCRFSVVNSRGDIAEA